MCKECLNNEYKMGESGICQNAKWIIVQNVYLIIKIQKKKVFDVKMIIF